MDPTTAAQQNNNISYDNLPLCIIANILSFLPVSDLVNASLTNKNWFDASLHEDITKKIAIEFNYCNFAPSNDKIKELMDGSRYFSKVIFNVVKFNEECDVFWIRFGKCIKDINFCYCQIEQKKFFHILKFLPNLKRLSIDQTESITNITLFNDKTENEKVKILKCLSNIDTIEFSSLENLTDNMFEKFISFTNEIKSFTLKNCYKIIIPSSLVNFCIKNEQSLRSLNIEGEQFNQEYYIDGLARLTKLKLKDFKIEIKICSDEAMDRFFKNQYTMDRLKIENLNNQTMTSVCKHFKNLRHLETFNSVEVNDSLRNIKNFTNIEVLRLPGVNPTSDDILCEMFKDMKPMLRELQLNNPMSNELITKIYETCPNLEDLDLIFDHQITKKGAQMIFKNLTKLKRLVFTINNTYQRVNTDQEDFEFIYSINNLEKLKYLDLRNVGPFVGLTIEDIAKLKNLTTLKIDRVFQLTEKDIKHLAVSLNNIEHIHFYDIHQMSDEIINFITKKWKKLISLTLGNCDKLTDKSLICIAENCKNIKELNLFRSKFPEDPMNIVRKIRKDILFGTVKEYSEAKNSQQ